MTTLTEGDLRITITEDVVNARKFDGPANHSLSHCMKAVDFIVELADLYLFIEIKDPQDPQVPSRGLKSFVQEFQSGQIDEDFKYKYRDSFLYEWASGRANKPIHYLILIGLDTLSNLSLLDRRRALERNLPLLGTNSSAWIRPIANFCGVFNIESWNRSFPDYQVTRLSSAVSP
jgi:hypothetical protein